MEYEIPLTMAMGRTSRTVKRFLDSKRKQMGDDPSTMNHGRIVGFIFDSGDKDIFQKDIEKEFDIRRSTATNTLKLMEKNGLITRERTSYDERLKKIKLTEKSLEDACRIRQEMDAINAQIEKGITKKERETFFAVLEKIERNIKEAKEND
ncbi:MAG: MarR family winged helix-turn-helix transcriptional regulator [Acutalibacteraceae bacterium]